MTAIRKALPCLLVALILSLPLAIYGEEPESTIKIIAAGIGANTDAARRNAVRNAIEQVIGVYVTADTIVRNHELLKDEILIYSGGYVKESRIIAEEPTQDGLVIVKLEVDVVSTKVKRKIESLNIAVKKVAGASLFDAASSRLEEKQTGADLLREIISKYPQAAYNFEIGAPQIESVDLVSGKAAIGIPIKIRWDQSFLDELRTVLSQVAREEINMVDILSFSQGSNRQYLQNGLVVCFSSHARIKTGTVERCMVLKDSMLAYGTGGDNEKRGTFRSAKSRSLINLPVSAEAMTLMLTFKDGEGTAVDSASYTFNRRDSDGCNKQKIPYERGNPRSSTLRFALSGEGFKPPNVLWRDLRNRRLLIITDGVFNIEVPVRMDTHRLKKVQTIEVHMNSWAK